MIAFGYDQPTDQIPAPPGDRGAVVDATLADLIGIGPGAQLALGPGAEQITVSHIVDDLTQGAPTIWLATADWRSVIGASDPTALPVTFAVTLLVVALFFALITLERVGLYAVLKAVGARTSDLLLGISLQAVVISVVAVAVGIAASLGFVAVLPADLPVRLIPSRLGLIAVGTVATALIGSLFTLRRILSIDPAEAIG